MSALLGRPELVVEGDGGGECEYVGQDALAEPGSVLARWRSRVRVPLQVQKMLSMRWRIGTRCGPRPGSSLRLGRRIVAPISRASEANWRPASPYRRPRSLVRDADGVLTVLDRLQDEHGAPGFLRMDNGPEIVAQALKDSCRFNTAGTIYTEPGSPWQNPYVESFNSRTPSQRPTPLPASKPATAPVKLGVLRTR